MFQKRVVMLGMVAVLGLSSGACNQLGGGLLGDAPPEEIWKKTCSRCHALDGRGTNRLGRMVNMRSEGWQSDHTDAQIEEIETRVGPQRHKVGLSQTMQAYGDRLSDEQIKGLVKYIRSFGAK